MENKIIVSGTATTYADSEIFGGVDYTQNVNPDIDMNYGTCASGELTFTIDDKLPRGTEITWKCKMLGSDAFDTYGVFYVDNVERKNYNQYTHTCYDMMSKLDSDCTNWFKAWLCSKMQGARSVITASFTLAEVSNALVNHYCGISFGVSPTPATYNTSYTLYQFLNINKYCSSLSATESTLVVSQIDQMPTITGRELLSYICEIFGVFAKVSRSGDAILLQPYQKQRSASTEYVEAFIPTNMRQQNSLILADYECPKITKVKMQNSSGKTFVAESTSVTTGNTYNVCELAYANPFCSLGNNAMNNLASGVLSEVSSISGTTSGKYTPFTMKLFSDKCINSLTGEVNAALDVGYVFKFEGLDYEDEVTSSPETSFSVYADGNTPITGGRSYSVSLDKEYHVSHDFVGKKLSEIKAENAFPLYIACQTSTPNIGKEYMFDGMYLLKATGYSTSTKRISGVVTSVVHCQRVYDTHYGIIMSKRITSSGVEISATGGEERITTEIKQ